MKYIHKMLIVIVAVALPFTVLAQPGPGPAFNPVPIDGFISLLLVAGARMGIKHYQEKNT